MPIRVLDSHTAELIAAGEVVERPASVVKELVENAIDAGATSIAVSILRGGISFIQIEDNGGGIPENEIPLAFVRHATSKISTEADLESIGTLGFRGEALASVASVARVTLLTKSAKGENACLYRISGGEGGRVEAAARPGGTTITVEDLFYNTPARMKFLKKDASEGTYVTETVGRLALSHPEVAFTYTREGKKVFATPGMGDLESAAYAVLGAEFARGLLPLQEGSGPYRVAGLITPPTAARASRSMQYFYINGRYVKNRTMMAALEQACRGRMMHGKFPGGILFLEMPPELVDVNVHPAKTEVRFAREQEVFEALYRAVKAALMQSDGQHRELDFGGEEAPALGADVPQAPPKAGPAFVAPPPAAQVAAANAMVRRAAEAGGMLESGPAAVRYAQSAPARPIMQGPSAFGERALDVEPPQEEPRQQTLVAEKADGAEPPRYVGELFGTYIVAQAGQQMLLIDKHAAHERILYEKIAAAHEGGHSQQLLAPLSVVLSAEEKDALLQNPAVLQQTGLEVEDFGGTSVLVRGVPAAVDTADVPGLVAEVAARMAVNPKDSVDSKTQWVLHSMACRAAVKAGDHTPPGQLVQLAAEILSGEVPLFCPHGRPVVLAMSRKDLEKQFGRLG